MRVCSRRDFLRASAGCAVSAAVVSRAVSMGEGLGTAKRPNVLLIVADDMNWHTPGCFGGGGLKGITPSML